MPSEDEIYAVYESYWSGYRTRQLDIRGAKAVSRVARIAARRDLKILRLMALLGTLQGKLVLEVGAGIGEFLLALRHAGANVIANEISSEACEFLEHLLQIPVIRSKLEDAAWQDRLPDVIVMNDLVEHPIDPLGLLSRAISLLGRGSRLMIWTPNGGAAGEDGKMAASWVGFRVDLEHLQYFSARTIEVLADRWGLYVDHLETTGYSKLSSIDTLSFNRKAGYIGSMAIAAKSLFASLAPWIPSTMQIIREWRRPRVRGSYHLFAVLRKP
jgi:2-polyprenyl-3-methyl-5-hydroxy-6-metoxy-1,4-benzoquinol methylase